MEPLRTPEEHFEDLPGYPWEANYVEVEDGVEMAYVDVPSEDPDSEEVFLCLHGEPTWSYLYRKMIPVLQQRGRVVAPDFIGFGRSDKLPNREDYTYDRHLASLQALIEELDLTQVTLVCQDWGGVLGLRTALVDQPDRFARIVAMNTFTADGSHGMNEEWHRFHDFVEAQAPDLPIGFLVDAGCATELPEDVWAAYEAPFPTPEYKAGAVEFPLIVPLTPDDPGAASQREATEALATWEEPFFTVFGRKDPITRDAFHVLRKMVPTASEEPETWIDDAGHFIQEDAGEEVAEHILAFVDRNPLP